jgi:DHA1 family multidrug resistance protein-like MFS transporter
MPTAMAYISDSTDERRRSGGMGVIGAAMGVGMVLGPGIGGWMGKISLSAPFFTAGVLSLLAVVLIYFILPESLPAEKRVQHVNLARGPQLAPMWKALFGPLGFLLFLAFIINFALANFEGIFGLFAAHRYGYDSGQVGTVMMLIGVISAVIQGLATGPVTERFGEANVIKVSLVFSAVGFLLMLLANNFAMVLLTVGLFVTSNAMLRPAIASATSKMAEGGQGLVMGLNNGYQSLGRTVGPLWAGVMFDMNLSFPYLTAAAIMLASFVASVLVAPRRIGQARQATEASSD